MPKVKKLFIYNTQDSKKVHKKVHKKGLYMNEPLRPQRIFKKCVIL